jgi:putative peptidoglycan lipid II flippase
MIPFGHVGIAIGSSIAAWINFWLLNKHAKQYGRFCITNETKIFALKNFVCGIIMVGFILISIHYFGELFYSDIFAIKAASILSTIAIAVVVFTISAYFLKIHKILLKKT